MKISVYNHDGKLIATLHIEGVAKKWTLVKFGRCVTTQAYQRQDFV